VDGIRRTEADMRPARQDAAVRGTRRVSGTRGCRCRCG
jgi:hypothetical protein